MCPEQGISSIVKALGLFHANREDSDQAGQPDLSLHCLQRVRSAVDQWLSA